MAEDLDTKTRSGAVGIPDDDPLAELARIIGFERPEQVSGEPEPDAFDLEAELMAELDFPAPDQDIVHRTSEPGRLAADAAPTAPSDNDFWSDATFDEEALLADAVAEVPVAVHEDADDQEFADIADDEGALSAVADDQDKGHTGPESIEPPVQSLRGNAQDYSAAPAADYDHDDVLAEMARFSIPDHGRALMPADNDDVDLGYTVDDDINAAEEANDPERFFEASSAAVREPVQRTGFEDFLSTELDIYERELTIGGETPVSGAAVVADAGSAGMTMQPEDAFSADLERLLDEPAPAAPSPDPVSAEPQVAELPEDFDSVFDLAAEEFLADSIPAEATRAQGDIWDMPGALDDALEEAVSEELESEFLGDEGMEPEDVPDLDDQDFEPEAERLFADADGDQELDLDLEQALAETISEVSDEAVDGELSSPDQEWPKEDWTRQEWSGQETDEPADPFADLAVSQDFALNDASLDQAFEQGAEPDVTVGEDSEPTAAFLAEFAEPALPVEPERDEIAEAFLDLIPGDSDEALADSGPAAGQATMPYEPEDAFSSLDDGVAPEAFHAPAEPENVVVAAFPKAVSEIVSSPTVAEEPEQVTKVSESDDWLSDFEAANDADMDADFIGEPDEAGPDFDARAISAVDEYSVPVADFDVPELPEVDAMVPNEPDFGDDIDVEFAGLGDTEQQNQEGATVLPFVPAGMATAAVAAASSRFRRDASAADTVEHEPDVDYANLQDELEAGFAQPYVRRESVDADAILAKPVGEYEGADEARGGSRPRLIAAAALGIALLVGAGIFGFAFMSGNSDTAGNGEPPVIRADSEPVKVVPENPGGLTVPNQDKAVYDRVAGDNANGDPGQPSLVTQSEEPVDIVQRTLDPELLPLEGRDDTGKSEERLSANAGGEDAAAPSAQPAVSPRKVRTMIVRPDGTIVAREEPAEEVAVAAPAATPAPEPAPQTEPVSEAAVDAQPEADAPQTEAASAAPEVAPAATDNAPASIAPVRVVRTQPIRPVTPGNAPVPEQRPSEQPVNVVSTVTQGGNVRSGAEPQTQAAATPQAAAPTAVAAPASNAGGYWVQIASQPTVEGAQASWNNLSRRFASVIGGRGVDIQRADIPGKGTFHRVRVPGGTRDQANALCSRYKAAGGSCFVSR